MYELYLNRAMEFFGVGKCREIFEMAIDSALPDQAVKSLCLKYACVLMWHAPLHASSCGMPLACVLMWHAPFRYAALERRLGEIDRARALYVHSSQFADPTQVRFSPRPVSPFR